MSNRTVWLHYALAYLLWIVCMILSLAFLLIGRINIPSVIATSFGLRDFDARQMAVLLDRVFVLVVGIGWLVLMIYGEHTLRTGVKSGVYLKRAAKIIGILLVLLFLADAVRLFYGFPGVLTSQWPFYLIELGLGIPLLVYGFRKKPLKQRTANSTAL